MQGNSFNKETIKLETLSKLINIHVQRVNILRIGGIKNLGMKTSLSAKFRPTGSLNSLKF